MSTKVLIVEDDALTALGMSDVLNFTGFQVIGPARSVSEAIRAGRNQHPHVAVVDINFVGRWDGIEGAHMLKKSGTEVVFVTAQSSRRTLARAAKLKPAAFRS